MARIAIFDPLATPNKIMLYIESAHTPDYVGRPDALIEPDVSAVEGIPQIYWKHVGGTIQPMTSQEQADVDAAIAQGAILAARAGASGTVDGTGADAVVLRAFADIVKDEINNLRQWVASFKAQTALATSLANLQSRVAGLPDMPDRTLVQLRNAIKARIDSGTVDA